MFGKSPHVMNKSSKLSSEILFFFILKIVHFVSGVHLSNASLFTFIADFLNSFIQ